QAFKRIIRRQSHAKGESQTRPPANPTSARKSAPVTPTESQPAEITHFFLEQTLTILTTDK
ncbi:hypothetical protein ACFFNA_39030, partial [Mesorhizobium kowhaii]|uniref:hypothetical protein n=1 Tax=Mesorhizobium kowhaii TaxID=1300272 RepID=UPI0035EA5F88